MAQFVYPRPRRDGRVIRTATTAALAALLVLGVGRVADLMPSLSNPFASETVDRSAPAVLHALEDVSQYRAASANYSVIVDLEKDTGWVPSFISGERTIFSAAGSVDASVDFSGLDESSITLEGDTVSVRLPRPELGEPVVDPARSRVVSRQRGALDRLGSVFVDSPTAERSLYLAAEQKFAAAAEADNALTARAATNTRQLLDRLLRPLGFSKVAVTFS